MSAGSLPQCVNVRKAVANEARYSGTLGGDELPQIRPYLDPENSGVEVVVACGRDEEGRQVVEVGIEGTVVLECQRCLQPVKLKVSSESLLALVLTDEQAKQLPPRYEPWIVADELDLWALTAEEMALSLPVVAYHPTGECDLSELKNSSDEEKDEEISKGSVVVDDDNPFSVLAELLDGSDGKEK